MTKYWWARVTYEKGDNYGRWVPTGQIDKQAAIDYMATYPSTWPVRVKEWLLL